MTDPFKWAKNFEQEVELPIVELLNAFAKKYQKPMHLINVDIQMKDAVMQLQSEIIHRSCTVSKEAMFVPCDNYTIAPVLGECAKKGET